MPSDLETNVRTALENMARALADASDVTVETRYKVVDSQSAGSLDNSTLAARTVIKLDGDHESVIPVATTETGAIVIEDALLDLHLRNVQAAIAYRASIVSALVDIFRRRGA